MDIPALSSSMSLANTQMLAGVAVAKKVMDTTEQSSQAIIAALANLGQTVDIQA